MGYTHYWQNSSSINDSEWEIIETVTRKILRVAQENRGLALSEEFDVNQIPVVTDQEIRFNGLGDEGHETFLVTRDATSFSFCKTNGKPYDDVVVAILHALATYCPSFSWTSDGYHADHGAGIAIYNEATDARCTQSNVTGDQS